jgi:hypothetical protein
MGGKFGLDGVSSHRYGTTSPSNSIGQDEQDEQDGGESWRRIFYPVNPVHPVKGFGSEKTGIF